MKQKFLNKMEVLNQLKITKEQTCSYFELEEESLQKSYAPGKWNVKELLHHLVDAETVLYERIRRGIAENKVVVWGFDQDAWCKNLDYKNQDLKLNKPIFLATRDAILSLTERYYLSHGANQYVHSETGLRTVKDEIDKVAWHNAHHLKQIETALKS